MAKDTIRLPDPLKNTIVELAKRENRSLNKQYTHLLQKAIESDMRARLESDPVKIQYMMGSND